MFAKMMLLLMGIWPEKSAVVAALEKVEKECTGVRQQVTRQLLLINREKQAGGASVRSLQRRLLALGLRATALTDRARAIRTHGKQIGCVFPPEPLRIPRSETKEG